MPPIEVTLFDFELNIVSRVCIPNDVPVIEVPAPMRPLTSIDASQEEILTFKTHCYDRWLPGIYLRTK